jgi:hypothetical protein
MWISGSGKDRKEGGGFSLQPPPHLEATTATSNSVSSLVKNLDKASAHRTETQYMTQVMIRGLVCNELFSITKFV